MLKPFFTFCFPHRLYVPQDSWLFVQIQHENSSHCHRFYVSGSFCFYTSFYIPFLSCFRFFVLFLANFWSRWQHCKFELYSTVKISRICSRVPCLESLCTDYLRSFDMSWARPPMSSIFSSSLVTIFNYSQGVALLCVDMSTRKKIQITGQNKHSCDYERERSKLFNPFLRYY